jgi:hypothetical protein
MMEVYIHAVIYFQFYIICDLKFIILHSTFKSMKTRKHISIARHSIRRILFLCMLAAVCSLPAYAGENTDAIIIEKAFPLYNYIARSSAFTDAMRNDKTFRRQSQQQVKRINRAMKQCNDVTCYAAAVQWKPDEIAGIGKQMARLCQDNERMHSLVGMLRSGDHYNLYNERSDAAFIQSVWNDAAVGVNGILDTYIKGKKPRYPAIDSISFPIDDAAFRERIRRLLDELVKQQTPKDLFFELPLKFALKALAINDRDEAARYEPLDEGMNKAAVSSIPGIPWASFRYSLILVPGSGPDKEGVTISPGSIQRCRLAAERYRRGLAPLIVVSGGHVHPNKTPYSEAVEMKKYMVQELGIPENAILIEPHARHTTTNLRNSARMVYRFNIPDTMKILTVSDPVQSAYIPKMEKRFLDELGYIPYRDMKVLSEEENEFYPIKNALQSNPLDPLDP